MQEKYLVLRGEWLIETKADAHIVNHLLIRLHPRHDPRRVSRQKMDSPEDEERHDEQDQRQREQLSCQIGCHAIESLEISERILRTVKLHSSTRKKIHRFGARRAVAGSQVTRIVEQHVRSILQDDLLGFVIEPRAPLGIEFTGCPFQQSIEAGIAVETKIGAGWRPGPGAVKRAQLVVRVQILRDPGSEDALNSLLGLL